jgi:hypothetical protein
MAAKQKPVLTESMYLDAINAAVNAIHQGRTVSAIPPGGITSKMYAEKNGITASTAGKKLLKAYKAGLLDRLSRVLLTGGTEYVFYPKGVLDVEDSGKSS